MKIIMHETIKAYLGGDGEENCVELPVDEFFKRCKCWCNGQPLSHIDRARIIVAGDVGTAGTPKKMKVRWGGGWMED